jgi:hypothetical protein
LTLHLIEDPTTYAPGTIPPQISERKQTNMLTSILDLQYNNDRSKYYPYLYVDEFWILSESLIPINDTLDKLPLTITYISMSLMKVSICENN